MNAQHTHRRRGVVRILPLLLAALAAAPASESKPETRGEVPQVWAVLVSVGAYGEEALKLPGAGRRAVDAVRTTLLNRVGELDKERLLVFNDRPADGAAAPDAAAPRRFAPPKAGSCAN